MPFCVKSWRVLDLITGGIVHEELDNHLARREVVVERFCTDKLGLEILNVHGGHSVYGGVFEFRAYES